MTKQTAYFLTQLRLFVTTHRGGATRELQKLHQELTGKKLFKEQLSRHLNLISAPHMDTVFVYLRFAQIREIIRPGTIKQGLFVYVDEIPVVRKQSKHGAILENPRGTRPKNSKP